MPRSVKDNILNLLHVLTWVIFIGLCVKTGTILVGYAFSFFVPELLPKLYTNLDLNVLYQQSPLVYWWIGSWIMVLLILQCLIFYYLLELFRLLDRVHPFSAKVGRIITRTAYLVFAVGAIGLAAAASEGHWEKMHYNIGNAPEHWKDYNTFLMMAVVLFILDRVFRKGMELKEENDLTI